MGIDSSIYIVQIRKLAFPEKMLRAFIVDLLLCYFKGMFGVDIPVYSH